MEIILTDLNSKLVNEWSLIAPKDRVLVYNEDFRKLKADAVVSPANSYAIMDGGVDLALRQHFGSHIQNKIRLAAITRFGSAFVPVGCAVWVSSDTDPLYKGLICAPTMNEPMSIRGTLNPYFSTMAALVEAKNNGCESVVLMGMGALTGQVPEKECAIQMMKAINDFESGVSFGCWDDVYMLKVKFGIA